MMIRTLFCACLCLCSMPIIVNTVVTGQGKKRAVMQRVATKHGLNLSAELDKKSYLLTDTMILKVRLKNVSQSEIFIHKSLGFGGGSSFQLFITDNKGRWIRPTFLRETFHEPSYSKDDFLKIQPGSSIEEAIEVYLGHYEIETPGKYQLRFQYRSPVSRKMAPQGLNVWTTNKGILEAQPISFEVIK